ncbi:MAG: hypothetical protein GY940_28755 [bacterium]|nr:hypothetical protein [bacterium]
MHLFKSLETPVPVIGVAKNPFKTAVFGTPVLRGQSQKPLIVTAVGMPEQEACERVKSMHGDFRIPTLLKLVDTESRRIESK